MFEKVARIQIVVFGIVLGLSLIFALVFGAKIISNNFSKDFYLIFQRMKSRLQALQAKL